MASFRPLRWHLADLVDGVEDPVAVSGASLGAPYTSKTLVGGHLAIGVKYIANGRYARVGVAVANSKTYRPSRSHNRCCVVHVVTLTEPVGSQLPDIWQSTAKHFGLLDPAVLGC